LLGQLVRLTSLTTESRLCWLCKSTPSHPACIDTYLNTLGWHLPIVHCSIMC